MAFKVGTDQNGFITILSESGDKGVRIGYSFEEGALWFDDTENGLTLLNKNGAALNSDAARAEANAILAQALTSNPLDVTNALTAVLENRILATDGNPDKSDIIEYDELESVHAALNAPTLLNAIATHSFYKAASNLAHTSEGTGEFSLWQADRETLVTTHATADAAKIMTAFRAHGIDEKITKDALEAEGVELKFTPTPEDAKKAQDAIDAQAKLDQDRKAQEDALKKQEELDKKANAEAEAKEAALNRTTLTNHRTISEVQKAFGLGDVDGTFDQGIKTHIQVQLEQTLGAIFAGEHAITLEEGSSSNTRHISLTNPANGKSELYEITKSDDGGAASYHIHALDDKKQRIEYGNGESSTLNLKEQVNEKHLPVLAALYDTITADLKDSIQHAEDKFSAEDQKQEERIKSEQRIAIDLFLKKTGQEDLSADIKKSVFGTPFNAAALKAKLKDTDGTLDDFIASMTALNAQRFSGEKADLYSDLLDLRAQHRTADGLFKMFNYMNTNEEYSAHKDEQLRQSAGFRDNIFAMGAYDILNTLGRGDKIPTRLLIDKGNDEQESKILRAFPGQLTVTREQALEYLRQEHDNNAIRAILGQDDISDLSAEDRKEALLHVSDAKMGRYVNDAGVNTLFIPFPPDEELLQKAFGSPDLTDAVLQDRIGMIRANGSTRVPGYQDVLSTFPLKADRKALFDEAKAYIGEEDTDFDSLTTNQKKAHLTTIASSMIPELYEKVSAGPEKGDEKTFTKYSKLVLDYYDIHLRDHNDFRNGDPDLDAEGRLTFDKDGYTTWENGTQGVYGGIHADSLTQLYAQLNRHHYLERIYGAEGADVFLRTPGRIDKSITYEGVKAELAAIDPALAIKFDESVRDMTNSSPYAHQRRISNSDNRRAYARQEIDRGLARKHAAEEANKPATDEQEAQVEVEVEAEESHDADDNKYELDKQPLAEDPFPKIPGGAGLIPTVIKKAPEATSVAKKFARTAAIPAWLTATEPEALPATPVTPKTYIPTPHTGQGPLRTDYLTPQSSTFTQFLTSPEDAWLNDLIINNAAPQSGPTGLVQRQPTDISLKAPIEGELLPRSTTLTTTPNELATRSNAATLGNWIEGEFTDLTDTRINGTVKTAPALSVQSQYVMALPHNNVQITQPGTFTQFLASPQDAWINSLLTEAPAPNKPLGLPAPGQTAFPTANFPAVLETTPATTAKPTLTQPPTPKSPVSAQDAWLNALISDEISSAKNAKVDFSELPLLDDMINKLKDATKIPASELDERLAVKTPSSFSAALTKLGKGAKGFGKGMIGLSKYAAGAGTILGATVSAAEVMHLNDNIHALEAAGLVTGDLNNLHTLMTSAFILQSTADFTIVGGEIGVKAMIDDLVEEGKLDPVTANMIVPDLLIDLIGNKSPDTLHTEYARTKAQWTEEKIEDMYTKINNKYGLLQDDDRPLDSNGKPISIGKLLRDDNYAAIYLAGIQIGEERQTAGPRADRTEIRPVYHKDKLAGYNAIMQINAMAGMAEQMINDYEAPTSKRRVDRRGRPLASPKTSQTAFQESSTGQKVEKDTTAPRMRTRGHGARTLDKPLENSTLATNFGAAASAQATQEAASFLTSENYLKELNDIPPLTGTNNEDEAPRANYVERLPDPMK